MLASLQAFVRSIFALGPWRPILAPAALAALLLAGTAAPGPALEIPDDTRREAERLMDAALADSAAFERLTELVDRFGHRFSGSVSLERAIDWILEGMEADGLENVRGEPVMVPHWVRGRSRRS